LFEGCSYFIFAKKTLSPRAILSFISSSIKLSLFTVDPRYFFANKKIFQSKLISKNGKTEIVLLGN